MTTKTDLYAARLDVDYPEKLDRVNTAFQDLLDHSRCDCPECAVSDGRLNDHGDHCVR